MKNATLFSRRIFFASIFRIGSHRSLAALGAAAVLFATVPAALGAEAAKASDSKAAALIETYEGKTDLAGLDVTSTFTLIQKKEGEADRVLRIQIYRRDAADTFTLLFQYPDSEKGKGYWRSKDDLFLYLPTTREFVYRNRKDDVGGSDIRADLFGKPNTLAQYWVNLAGTAKVSSWDCDVVRLDAKKLDVAYPVQKIYFRKTDGLPVKTESFSAGETLLRTTYFVDYKALPGGKYIFTKILAIDALEKGQKTYLTNEGVATDKIPDYTFSKAFLEEKSR
ncbi:MAG TPA: outer membrane lipoprotein-sorting protein [Treponemataceae bacterium]|nr:outer membrane lipoprotein-sorting protein [Treponemataceae bacterium]